MKSPVLDLKNNQSHIKWFMKSYERHICKIKQLTTLLNTTIDNLVYFLLYKTTNANCKVYGLYKNIAILDYDILLLPSVFFSLHIYPCGEYHISLFSCHPTYFLNIIYRINKKNYRYDTFPGIV